MKYACDILSSRGRRETVTIDADDENSLRRQLRRQGATPLGIAAAGDFAGIRRPFRRRLRFDLHGFTNRLAPLLDADIPLEQALAVIEESSADRGTVELVHELRRGLHEGKRFSQLTRERPEIFPTIYSSLLETGEEAGCLAEVVRELRRFLKESKEFREFLITSSIYPAIILSVTLLVVVLLFTVFIPRFARIFAEMGREMPLLTRIMLETGSLMQNFWWLLPLAAVAVGVLARRRRHDAKLQARWDALVLRIPVFSRLLIAVQTGRFIRTLAIMVQNHVHLLAAVRIANRVIGNSAIAASFAEVDQKLRGGARLSAILGGNRFMPTGSVAMLRIAEESGDLGEMLNRIASETEEEVRIRLRRVMALFEPVVILLLAGIVLLVVLAIFLAIMEMNVIK